MIKKEHTGALKSIQISSDIIQSENQSKQKISGEFSSSWPEQKSEQSFTFNWLVAVSKRLEMRAAKH